MSLQLYDTLTGQKAPFSPADPDHARIYVCGPTVYDYAHLGHARCYIVYDVLTRHLRASGLRVTYVRNVTDIDDKIIKRAAERGEQPDELAARFTDAFGEDMARLGNATPDVEPRVSGHLPHIIALVQRLIASGNAYEVDGDVYFSVESFEGYGKLSHRDLSAHESGASGRTDAEQMARKRHPADFALWKSAERSEVGWDSPFGWGRPGWHIECSAMSMEHLGETLDLHGGGLDLVFPHHENELAQSEAATQKPFSRCWMHNGFVEVNKEKMGKSLGNFFTARELFRHIEPEAIRMFSMTVHYRAPLGFDVEDEGGPAGPRFPGLEEAERRLEYLYKTRQRLAELPEARVVPGGQAPDALVGFPAALARALDDDLNMPVALAALSELLSAVNELCDGALRKKGSAPQAAVDAALAGFEALRTHLGLGFQEPREVLERVRDRRAQARGVSREWVEQCIVDRATARANKDFEAADKIRVGLTEAGVELLDSPAGTTWQIV
ncbi:MAG: cysteine--tRNA ligase [Sandaracinaceae bacterium]|nr:cysteine--tRNA ligase [Myxococcales bacterium]MCB9661644.1 cysteine--tRNA ligase [Sandaracinaceae bacterium]